MIFDGLFRVSWLSKQIYECHVISMEWFPHQGLHTFRKSPGPSVGLCVVLYGSVWLCGVLCGSVRLCLVLWACTGFSAPGELCVLLCALWCVGVLCMARLALWGSVELCKALSGFVWGVLCVALWAALWGSVGLGAEILGCDSGLGLWAGRLGWGSGLRIGLSAAWLWAGVRI